MYLRVNCLSWGKITLQFILSWNGILEEPPPNKTKEWVSLLHGEVRGIFHFLLKKGERREREEGGASEME